MRALAASMVAAVLLLLAATTGDASPPCCAHVPAGLVSWWPGNDNATDIVSGHDGTFDGGGLFAPAEVGHGFSFDSSDDIVKIGDDPTYSPGTDSFSVDAWIKTSGPEGAGGSAEIIRHYECANSCPSGAADGDWELRVIGGKAWGFIRDDSSAGPDGGGQAFIGTTTIEDGAFHHVALVRDMVAGKGRLYVDGQLQDEQALVAGSNGAITNADGEADDVTIGGGILGGSANVDPLVEFIGVIDEVDWWRSALTSADIAGIAAAGPNGKCTDEVAPVSSATAPATSASGAPISVSYTGSDTGGSGLARVILLVRTPGATGFTQAATDTSSTGTGTFSYTPAAGAGDYGFATTAEDANCGREAAPADPDAVTTVARATSTPPPAPAPPAKAVPITQIATLPSTHACVSRRHFPIHLKGVKGIVKAVVKLTGVPARTVTGKALGLPIDLRGLPKGKVVVRITVTTKSGKRLVGKRTYHTCANRRIVKKKH